MHKHSHLGQRSPNYQSHQIGLQPLLPGEVAAVLIQQSEDVLPHQWLSCSGVICRHRPSEGVCRTYSGVTVHNPLPAVSAPVLSGISVNRPRPYKYDYVLRRIWGKLLIDRSPNPGSSTDGGRNVARSTRLNPVVELVGHHAGMFEYLGLAGFFSWQDRDLAFLEFDLG